MGARLVEVSLFICSHRELSHMAAQGIFGQFEADLRTSSPSLFPFQQLEISYVGHEIGLPSPSRIPSTFVVKIVFLRVETIPENIVTVKYKIEAVNEVHHAWRAGHRDITGRLTPHAIKMLV